MHRSIWNYACTSVWLDCTCAVCPAAETNCVRAAQQLGSMCAVRSSSRANCVHAAQLLNCVCAVHTTARAGWACATQLLGCACLACASCEMSWTCTAQLLRGKCAVHPAARMLSMCYELSMCYPVTELCMSSWGQWNKAPASSPGAGPGTTRWPRCCRPALGRGLGVEDPALNDA